MMKPNRDEDEIKAAFREMYDDVLNENNPGFGDYSILNSFIFPVSHQLRRNFLSLIRKDVQFAKTWASEVINHFGKEGSKLAKMDLKKFSEVVNLLLTKQKPPSGFANMKLKDFSTWLADFDQSNYPSTEVCFFIALPLEGREENGERRRKRRDREIYVTHIYSTFSISSFLDSIRD